MIPQSIAAMILLTATSTLGTFCLASAESKTPGEHFKDLQV